MFNTRPIYSRLPTCYKTDGLPQIVASSFFRDGRITFVDGNGDSYNLSFPISEIFLGKYIYIVNFIASPFIEKKEFGDTLPDSYLVIPTDTDFVNNPPQLPLADWLTRFFDKQIVEKYLKVQRFFKEYLDYDRVTDPVSIEWLLEFSTGDFFRAYPDPNRYTLTLDRLLAARFFHSNEPECDRYWVYYHDGENPVEQPVPPNREIREYNLTTGEQKLLSVSQAANKYSLLTVQQARTVYDSGTIEPVPNHWLSRLSQFKQADWLGINGSLGNATTLHFLLDFAYYYGYRASNLAGDNFQSTQDSLSIPLRLWEVHSLIVSDTPCNNRLVADIGVACDPDCFNKGFLRMPASIPRREWASAKVSMAKNDSKKVLEISFAYFAADYSIAEEPVFDLGADLDRHYLAI